MSHYEELLQCPYNRSHRILPHAMQRHLFKCRKNYPSTKLVACPFNTVHRLPGPELKLHLESCGDRATFDLYKYCISSGPSRTDNCHKDDEPELIYHDVTTVQRPGKTLLDDDECWDDFNLPAYNPQQYCRTAKIIRKATLMKPADKQKFYREEHQRHKELENAIHSNKEPSFKSNRNPVPESKYYNREPTKAFGKSQKDDDESWDEFDIPAYNPQEYNKNAKATRIDTRMQQSEKNNLYRQSKPLRVHDSGNKFVETDIDEISDKFSRNVYVGTK